MAGARPGRVAPSLAGLDGWQQSAPRSLTALRGRVVVVWFFTTTDPCLGMVPALRALDDHGGTVGTMPTPVQVIGVHAPGPDEQADPLALAQAVAHAGVTWPVAMDHHRRVLRRWLGPGDVHLPTSVVVGAEGRVAGLHAGSDVAPVAELVRHELGRAT